MCQIQEKLPITNYNVGIFQKKVKLKIPACLKASLSYKYNALHGISKISKAHHVISLFIGLWPLCTGNHGLSVMSMLYKLMYIQREENVANNFLQNAIIPILLIHILLYIYITTFVWYIQITKNTEVVFYKEIHKLILNNYYLLNVLHTICMHILMHFYYY